jgi:hypothetical protein
MSNGASQDRASIIDAVKTPLGFCVLGLLVIDGTLAAMAITLEQFRTELVWTVIASVPILVLSVLLIAVYRPEALRGVRPWQESYANQLADDLYMGLDGALGNLGTIERMEAWLTVADVIVSSNVAERAYASFCGDIATRLRQRANLHNRRMIPRGSLEATAGVEVDPA